MSTLVVATSAADAQAVEAIKDHHSQLAGALAVQVETLIDAAVRADSSGAGLASKSLVSWCQSELIPHALAEERTLYPKAHEDSQARLLVDAMIAEHRDILALVEAIGAAQTPVRAAANAQALLSIFNSHLVKENEQILPLLAQSSAVSLAELLGGMHELLGDPAVDMISEGGCGGDCTCGEQDLVGVLPELDSRVVPHAIRHATIFGALGSVAVGNGLVLIASHDPLPLLAQVEQRTPGHFSIDYLESGPETWRLRFVRV
jgi:uncharacterized protein (DUF2249 family)/iron-sulfur cluster repair protein YtfE (RIC family)